MYAPEIERAFLKEWHTLAATLDPEFSIRTVDVLAVTACVVRHFGAESLVDLIKNPMPGSDPTSELGSMWTNAVARRVHEAASKSGPGRPVVVVERLAALYPVSGPRALMQTLWDSDRSAIEAPIVLLIPGVLIEARVYRFVGQVKEFMYRGDIL